MKKWPKTKQKREWELIYEKGEFDAMEIGFFFKRNISGEPIWADTCLYGILKDEWE